MRYEKNNGDIRENGLPRKIALAAHTIWNPTTFREIRALIRAEKPDIVHCHNTFPVISPSVYWAAAREGVPVVQTLHNYRLACLNGYLFREGAICEDCLGRAPWRGVCRGCYRSSRLQSAAVAAMLLVHRALGTYRRKVSRYIALTDFAKSKFVEAGLPAEKIVVKPNALVTDHKPENSQDPNSEPESDNSRTPASAKRPRVLYLGRLSPEKGPDVLLAAWKLFQESSEPDTKEAVLTIAGDGPERVALEKAAEGLYNVEFLGQVPKSDIPSLLKSSSLLVLPSRCYEQFSTTVMEAFFNGIPAIVGKSVKHATIVEENVSGRFFESGDPASLANALRDILSDSERLLRMGENAQSSFKRSACVPERNLERLLAMYQSCR